MKKIKSKEKINISFNYLKALSSLNTRETESIITHLSKLSREHLFTYPNKDLGIKVLTEFKKIEKKRQNNWPLPYLLSYKDFFDMRLKVSPSVLIPRPETEILVEKVIQESQKNNEKKIFLDIGCGSGAIIIALAKNIPSKNIFLASDISSKALSIAKENIKNNKLQDHISLKKSDLLVSHRKTIKDAITRGEQIIITANLPYLNSSEMKESSIQREPRLALFSKDNGLGHYKRLLKQLASIINNKDLTEKNINIFLICEINPHQSKHLIQEIETILPDSTIEVMKDLRKKNRFITVKISTSRAS